MKVIRNKKWLKARTFFMAGLFGIPFGILFNISFDISKGVATNFQNLIADGIVLSALFLLMILYANKKSFEID